MGGDRRAAGAYVLERFLYRLSISSHRDRLVLKGGMLLAAFEERRRTRNVDLLGLGITNDADAVTVLVAGDGIAAAQLPHAFERFYGGDASRRSGSGSGIGLTIARAIARAHGGELTATSPGAGQGSSFIWHVPKPTDRANG